MAGLEFLFTPPAIVLSLIAVVLTIIHVTLTQSRLFRMGNKLPGPPALPFVGNSHLLIGKSNHQIVKYMLKLSEVYGRVTRGVFGKSLMVFLTDPNDIELILNSQEHIQKSDEYRFFKPWLGDGLLLSSGEKWRNDRKLIAPAFHQNVLKSFVGIFNSNSLAVVERLKKEVGKEFDVHDYMSETTVDILLETAMGTNARAQNKDGFEYAMAVMKMCDILHKRHLKMHLRFDAIFNLTAYKKKQEKLLGIIHGLTKKVLQTKKGIFESDISEGKVISPTLNEVIRNDKNKENAPTTKKSSKKAGLVDDLDEQDENDIGEKRRMAFLDLMIETAHNGANLSDNDIKEQVDTIMFEGHDTTAAGSSFILCLLGIHQHIQEKVMEEQYKIFGTSNRQATFNDTVEMKYLERVILESLRMYPPVPLIARKVNRDIQLVTGNYVVPAGATVAIATFNVHRLPEYYPNPKVFDPDNFLPERTHNRHYYSYMPFSLGPRSCVGRKYAMLKLKILVSTILRNFHVKSNLQEKDFRLEGDIILKREEGFQLVLEDRVAITELKG